jgi:hypothetical protein
MGVPYANLRLSLVQRSLLYLSEAQVHTLLESEWFDQKKRVSSPVVERRLTKRLLAII